MSDAIERLAAELMKIPDDQWRRIAARWHAGLGWEAAFGPAWDEISERLNKIEWQARPDGPAPDVAGSRAR